MKTKKIDYFDVSHENGWIKTQYINEGYVMDLIKSITMEIRKQEACSDYLLEKLSKLCHACGIVKIKD